MIFQAFSPAKNFFKKISTLLLTVLTNGAKIQSNKGKVLKEKGTCARVRKENSNTLGVL